MAIVAIVQIRRLILNYKRMLSDRVVLADTSGQQLFGGLIVAEDDRYANHARCRCNVP